MKKIILSFFVIISYGISAQIINPGIQSLADSVQSDTLLAYLQKFESFGVKTPGSLALENTRKWIENYYEQNGYQRAFADSFLYMANTLVNLGYVKIGTSNPDKFLVVCAHYDSYGGPGANDNGSGTAVLLEMARILRDVNTAYSILFIHFSAEEEGLIGSSHFVNSYLPQHPYDIFLVLNIDEVGGVAHQQNLAVRCERDESFPSANNALSWAYTDSLCVITQNYSSLTTVITHAYGSDYMPFQSANYVITGFYEDNESNVVHGPNDLVQNLSSAYVYQIARASLGASLHFACLQTEAQEIQNTLNINFRVYLTPDNRYLLISVPPDSPETFVDIMDAGGRLVVPKTRLFAGDNNIKLPFMPVENFLFSRISMLSGKKINISKLLIK